MDHGQAPAIRQRHRQASAVGGHGQREPVQGGQEPRRVEAAADQLLLRLRESLGPGQVLLGFVHH